MDNRSLQHRYSELVEVGYYHYLGSGLSANARGDGDPYISAGDNVGFRPALFL